MVGFPWRPESAQETGGLCSSHFKRVRDKPGMASPTDSWFGWRCEDMSGNYVTQTRSRASQDDASQRSVREILADSNAQISPLSILTAMNHTQATTIPQLDPASVTNHSFSSWTFHPSSFLYRAAQEICITRTPHHKHYPHQSTWCWLTSLGVNLNPSSPGHFLSHLWDLSRPHHALHAVHPFTLCRITHGLLCSLHQLVATIL